MTASAYPSVADPLGGDDESGRPEAPPPSLALRGISRSYGRRPVLQDVDLTIERGQSVLVTGANGAGKTTLLRVVSGMITPHAGSLSLFGLDPAAEPTACRRRIGFLPAGDRSIYARLTVRRNLEFWSRIAYVPSGARRAAVDDALRELELEEIAKRRTDRLSMGQRQRVRIAMAFLHKPDLLLLDEPDSSLDEGGVGLLRAAAERALDRGASVLWCAPTGSRETLPCHRAYAIADGVLEPA